MQAAQKIRKTHDFSDCTIYSNFEPCPMCSFMMRELKFGAVVFALTSKDMGGYSRWPILQDNVISNYTPEFGPPPKVLVGILQEKAKKQFDDAGWTVQN